MADVIIVLGDEEGASPSACVASTSSSNDQAKKVSPLKLQQPVSTHITKSPFASAKTQTHVLQAENERLFSEVSNHIQCLLSTVFTIIRSFSTNHHSWISAKLK